MPVVILKPTLIYGPFSQSWVGNMIQQLNRDQPVFVEDGGIANLVYVDDVVYAVIHAIECDAANDGSFFINNDDKRISWADYVAQLASFSHVSPRAHPSGDLVLIRVKKLAAMLFDSLFVFGRNLSSQEMLVMLERIPLISVLGSKLGYERSGERSRCILLHLAPLSGPLTGSSTNMKQSRESRIKTGRAIRCFHPSLPEQYLDGLPTLRSPRGLRKPCSGLTGPDWERPSRSGFDSGRTW